MSTRIVIWYIYDRGLHVRKVEGLVGAELMELVCASAHIYETSMTLC